MEHSSIAGGMQVYIAMMEINAVTQEAKNTSTSRSTYTTLGHIPKGCFILFMRHVFNHIHFCSISNSHKLKQSRRSSTEEWTKKAWYIYTMEYFSAGYKKK